MNIKYVKKNLDLLSKIKGTKEVRKMLTSNDRELVSRKASELAQNIFTFDKPWDMERCVIPFQLDKIDWNVTKNDDEEWCFMLNRMDYLNYLILSEDINHRLKAKELILDWIDHHQEIVAEPSTRTLDTGIRIMNMFEALPYLYSDKLLSDEELTVICESILKQGQYLKENYLTKYITSNWGSIQTCALVSVLPYIDEENEVYKWALTELDRQLRCQVYPDGMHWEQSTMYHIEVLNYGMKAVYYNKLVSEEVKMRVYMLAKSLFYQVTPHKEIETFGDSDRSNIQDVFTRATMIFENAKFKYMGFEEMDIESLYTLGSLSAKEYLKIEAIKPTQLYYNGHDSGMFVARSSFDSDANYVMYTNGSLGSGHGHSDNLHVSIYFKGNPVCIDAGRLTYREDHPLRVELKSMKAHNGVIVDDHQSLVPSDSWGYADFGIPLKNYIRHAENMHYYEGTLLSHDPLQAWTRKVIFFDQGIWMIVDEVKEDGNHEMVTRFHLEPGNHPLKGLQIDAKEEVEVSEEICSLRYNEESKHNVLKFKKSFVDSANQCITFLDKKYQVEDLPILQNGDTPLSDDIATGKKFIIDEDEYYAVAVFHKEVFKGKKILFIDNEPFHAKVFVVHYKGGTKKTYILRA